MAQTALTISMPAKILVVEDERSLIETLEYNLSRQGYEVIAAVDGIEALGLARREHPDLILLDVMLPRMDGVEVCRILRQETKAPILMLTARNNEIDTVVGLEVGADDYITKPFSMRELLARVKAHLRRTRLLSESASEQSEEDNSVERESKLHTADDMMIDIDGRRVMVRNEWFHLKPMEFELLVFFARHWGVALSREQILQRVWGWDYTAGSRTVDVHVRWLREKIETDPANPKRIITVRGVGYRFDG
jgi:DNA-binding response OmpR family regulator